MIRLIPIKLHHLLLLLLLLAKHIFSHLVRGYRRTYIFMSTGLKDNHIGVLLLSLLLLVIMRCLCMQVIDKVRIHTFD